MGFDMDKGHHFIAIHAKVNNDGASIVGECVPTQGSATPPFTDDDAVFQITEETTGIKFTISKDDETQVVQYALDVTLAPESEE